MLQLDQVVWDGGNIRARKEVTRATSEVDKQKLEVDMYAINERVNQLFFGILLLKEQLKQNQLMQEELQRNYDNVAAYVKNGIANQADLDAVKVEQLNNIQQRHTLEATYRAYGEMLKIMINHPTPLTENTLKKPDVNALLYKGEAYSTEFIRRPELNLFATQNQQLEAQRKQLTAKNLPRLDLFVQGAYGNPGLNMLKNEFSAYYVAGVRLSWNFGNLYTRKNESRQLILNQQDVNVQKETFLFNTHLEITQNNSEIKKLTELMKNDEEIITLRNNIKKSAQAKVANGTLTVTEMLREVTAENIAMQDKILHEIQLLSAIYELKYTTNKYILLAATLLGLSSCGNKRGDYDASGTFEATEVIVSSEANGKIMQFNIEEGQLLKAGEEVGCIDTLQLYLKKMQLLASGKAIASKSTDINKQIAATKEQIGKAEYERKRTENLLKENAATQKQIDDIDSQIAVLKKQLEAQISTLQRGNASITEESSAYEIQVAQLDDQLRKCHITSPICGTVLAKYAEAGELATQGKPLFKVADVQHLFLRAYITADQLSQLKLGDKVKVFSDLGKDDRREYEGTITWISDKSEFTPKTIQTRDERANLVYATKIAVKNDGYIKIGMYGEMKK